MEILRRNIGWNLLGGFWVGLLTLVITPMQVNLLGIETFGLIGFLATLQVVMAVLDFGLTTTITREIAGDQTPHHQASLALLRTATTLYWGIAVLVGTMLFAAGPSIARIWFKPDTIKMVELIYAIQIVAIVLALRWPVSLYAGVLTGMQQMDVLNAVRAAAATTRLLGGILVLLISPELNTFLAWIAFAAAAEVALYLIATCASFPASNLRPGFSFEALRMVLGYSVGMSALGVLSVAISQLDRLLISKIVPLQDLGYYTLAHMTGSAISLIVTAFSSALMPAFAAAYGANLHRDLVRHYNAASLVLVFATGGLCFLLIFFSHQVISVWVGPDAAAGAYRPLALLAAGYWISAAVSPAYTLSISCRMVYLPLKVSLASAFVYAPLLYVLTRAWGIDGAAVAWLFLFIGYLLIIAPLVHRKILTTTFGSWCLRVLAPCALLGFCTFGSAKLFLYLTGTYSLSTELAAACIAAVGYVMGGLFFLGSDTRIFLSDVARLFGGHTRTP